MHCIPGIYTCTFLGGWQADHGGSNSTPSCATVVLKQPSGGWEHPSPGIQEVDALVERYIIRVSSHPLPLKTYCSNSILMNCWGSQYILGGVKWWLALLCGISIYMVKYATLLSQNIHSEVQRSSYTQYTTILKYMTCTVCWKLASHCACIMSCIYS